MLRQYLDLPRAVHILCLGTLINRAGSFFMVFLTIYVGDRLGQGPRFATICVGAYGLGSLLGALTGGQLADQIGRRATMLISLCCGSLILTAFPFVASRPMILFIIFLYALTMDMYRPAAAAMISDVTRPEDRPAAFGLLYLAINLGFSIGAGIGGTLAAFSFIALFLSDAATTFIYGLIVLTFVVESLPRLRPNSEITDSNEATGATRPNGNGNEKATERVSLGEAARHIARDWPFLLFCFGCLLGAVVFMQSMSTLPLYLKQRGFTSAQYGWIISLNGIMIVLLQVPMTVFLRRFDRLRVIALGDLAMGLGFGLCAFAGSGLAFAGTVVIWTIGELMQAPFTQAVIADLAPVSMRARYMGVFTMSFSSSLMIGAPLGGFVLDRWGGPVLWTGAFALCMMGGCILLAARRGIVVREAKAERNRLSSDDIARDPIQSLVPEV